MLERWRREDQRRAVGERVWIVRLVIGTTSRPLWYPRAMPSRDYPDCPAFDPVKETVLADNDLAKRQIAEFRDNTPQVGEIPKPGESVFHSAPEGHGGGGSLGADVGECRQELGARGWRERDLQRHESPSSSSASAITCCRS